VKWIEENKGNPTPNPSLQRKVSKRRLPPAAELGH
jgi:hypothetical protein